MGLIEGNNESDYRNQVMYFTDWCSENFLNLNIKKTKEMIIDLRNKKHIHSSLSINNENVELVSNYTYLGNVINDKLKVNDNVIKIQKKVNQRLYFLRKLKSFHVDNTILTLFYKSIVQSVLCYCIINWYNLLTSDDLRKLNKVVKTAKRLGCNVQELEDLYKIAMLSKVFKIRNNECHPLYQYFRLLPSGKRISSIHARTSRYNKCFTLSAIRIFNM